MIVARDSTVLALKGRAPVQNEEERKAAIEHAYPNVHVVLGDMEDFLKPVQEINPDLILLGYDQKLPPGVEAADLPCKTERMPALQPDVHKSSLRRMKRG